MSTQPWHPVSRFIFGPAGINKQGVLDADYYGQVADDEIDDSFGDITVVRSLTPEEILAFSDFDTGPQVISDDCFDPAKVVKWELVTCSGGDDDDEMFSSETQWILVSF